MDDSTECTERLREQWLTEQFQVSRDVIVLADEDEPNSTFSVLRPLQPTVDRYFGGVDVSFPDDSNAPAVAVYVIIAAVTMDVVYKEYEFFHLTVPYIPSFLAFREIDPIVRLIEKQMNDKPELRPSAILVDGNGILHPRRAGIACFVGVRTGIPTIGIGKTLYSEGGLTKEAVLKGIATALEKALDYLRSSTVETVPIRYNAPIVGSALSPDTKAEIPQDLIHTVASKCKGLVVPLAVTAGTENQSQAGILAAAVVAHGRSSKSNQLQNQGTKVPIFVSVGHSISLQKAVEITAYLSTSRIPEPVRQADLIGRDLMRKIHSNNLFM